MSVKYGFERRRRLAAHIQKKDNNMTLSRKNLIDGEWVGDAGTAQFLREAGATYLQGFLYGMPIAVEELPPWA